MLSPTELNTVWAKRKKRKYLPEMLSNLEIKKEELSTTGTR